MRRISIAMMLLFVAPNITQAYHYGVPLRYRVQFSSYAFGYRNNGLIPGGLTYSSYAFSPGSSGLVFEGVRYIPYAFTYESSGLVLDYYWYPIPYPLYSPYPPNQTYSTYNEVLPSERKGMRQPGDTGTRSRSRHYRRDMLVGAPADRPSAPVAKEDTIAAIRRHLRERGFSDVGINRILRIDNQLVSVNFTLSDRNLLIKYWNPTQLERLEAKTESTRKLADSLDSRMIDKYKKDWEAFAGDYQQEGGEIYVVAASGETEIVAALDACERLGPNEAKPSPQAVYARQ